MIKRITATHHQMQFDNLAELVQWVEDTPYEPTWRQRQSVAVAPRAEWDLGVGFRGAMRLARDGWEEGIQNLFAASATVPTGYVYEHRYNVAGERADVPRYLAGDPFHMVTRGKVRKPKPVMTIALNISAGAGVTAAEMANFGAAIVALVDRLESRNVRAEVIGTWSFTCSGKRFSMIWTVKRAEDALDLSAVAFSLAHPAMLRRLGFAVLERSGLHDEPGYGRANSELSVSDFADLPEGALLIGGIGRSAGACRSIDGALSFVKSALDEAAAKLGMDPIAELEAL